MATNSRPELKLDWCSYEAAKYAVTNWHYSKTMPSAKLVKIGAWEDQRFIGCVIYSRGANNRIGSPYGLKQTEVCELTRVALTAHKSPVSRILSVSLKLLRGICPGLRLVVSYADPMHGHIGGVYQANGWIYTGVSEARHATQLRLASGELIHKRTATARFGTSVASAIPGSVRSPVMDKHKYLMPLDDEMRDRIAPLAKPYPKRAGSTASDATATHAGEGGAIPTPALHSPNLKTGG